MYLVAVTTAEFPSATTFVYLHPADRRIQLSPFPEPITTREDAGHAMALAQDFYDSHDVITARYITITGPDGPIHESYRGPREESVRQALVRKHAAALNEASLVV